MKTLLVSLLLITQSVFGQQYKETIKECTNALMNGLSNPPNEAEVKKKLDEFGTCLKGTKIPYFTATSLTGTEFTPQTLEGQVVLINFWFTTCSPCLLEIPALNSLKDELKDEPFTLLSFATNDVRTLTEFLKKRTVDFEIVPDAKKIIEETFLTGLGYPTNIIIDKQGRIVEFSVGGGMNAEEAKKGIENLKTIIVAELIE